MVISIRRSRHEEGEELVAIWCRSVDATHDFLSAEYRAELEELVRSFLPEAPLWVAVNERDRLVGFMLFVLPLIGWSLSRFSATATGLSSRVQRMIWSEPSASVIVFLEGHSTNSNMLAMIAALSSGAGACNT